MSFASLRFGERIVLVARMATDAHLAQLREEKIGRQRTAGGAGLNAVTDDQASSDSWRADPFAPIAEGEGQ